MYTKLEEKSNYSTIDELTHKHTCTGDEPLYDHDAPSATNLAGHIKQMKRTFSSAGLHDMPVSISELAYGWQITDKSDAQPLIDVLDFFMINSFPYFAFDAQSGGSDVSWKDFVGDLEYYEGIAKGKPLLVTQVWILNIPRNGGKIINDVNAYPQTGWPSNRNTWSPNSPDVVVSVESEKGFWDLLDGHCEDFFKSKRIGWSGAVSTIQSTDGVRFIVMEEASGMLRRGQIGRAHV